MIYKIFQDAQDYLANPETSCKSCLKLSLGGYVFRKG
jgi:hypothetical protein